MRTYGSTAFETELQYAPPTLPGRGSASMCARSTQLRKMSPRRGWKPRSESSTIATASVHSTRRSPPIGAYWSASWSRSSPSTSALRTNQRRPLLLRLVDFFLDEPAVLGPVAEDHVLQLAL